MRTGVIALAAVCGVSSLALAPRPGVAVRQELSIPECGHDVTGMPGAPRLDVPAILADIPEFHDCQRFVRRRAREVSYTAQFAIFVRFGLDSLYGAAGAPSAATRPPAGVVPGAGAVAPVAVAGAQSLDAGLTVAVVWAGDAYSPLKIERGLNCLVLRRNGAGFDAFMLHTAGSADSTCLRPSADLRHVPTDPSGVPVGLTPERQLDVRVSDPGVPDADVPPVIRWDTDLQDRPFIHVKCPQHSCDIGSAGLALAPRLTAPAGMDAPARRVIQERGWRDEQRLAVRRAGAADLIPSTLRGRVFPHPRLDALTANDFRPGLWLEAAAISITGPGAPGAYQQKLGVMAVDRQPDWGTTRGNRLWLCTRVPLPGATASFPPPPADACQPSSEVLASCRVPAGSSLAAEEAAGHVMFAYMAVNGRVTRRFCVTRRPWPAAYGGPAPGTARWRWTDQDDTIWVRCPSGCCEIEER